MFRLVAVALIFTVFFPFENGVANPCPLNKPIDNIKKSKDVILCNKQTLEDRSEAISLRRLPKGHLKNSRPTTRWNKQSLKEHPKALSLRRLPKSRLNNPNSAQCISPEKQFLSAVRRKFIHNPPRKASQMRTVYAENKPLSYFTRMVWVNGRQVYQRDELFEPLAKTLNHEGQWESNIDRMLKGLAPIGKKGIVSKEERVSLSANAIWKKQDTNITHLHHITQKDKDPIYELSRPAHTGIHDRWISEEDPETHERRIVACHLTKEEVNQILQPHQKVHTNTLHGLPGVSRIDRKKFGEWRVGYWIVRGRELCTLLGLPMSLSD